MSTFFLEGEGAFQFFTDLKEYRYNIVAPIKGYQ